MAQEIETKVLNIDKKRVVQKIISLGARKKKESRLTVHWYWLNGIAEGEDPWFLRIRSDSVGRHEVTWKAVSTILGTARKHKEINFDIHDHDKLADLFIEIGLEKYAHQEKERVSFEFMDWSFDIDQYPGMPAFIEIEGNNEEHVNQAIKLLGLEDKVTWANGERILIQEKYGLDWYDMRF